MFLCSARLALAAKAAAIAVAQQDYTSPPADLPDEVLWEGPIAIVAYPTASGDVEVVFNSSGKHEHKFHAVEVNN